MHTLIPDLRQNNVRIRSRFHGTFAAALLAASLAFAPSVVLLTPAIAEQSDEVRAQAASESERLDALVQEMERQRAEVDDLDSQIDQMAEQSVSLQDELIASRQSLSRMINDSYKNGGIPTLPEILLASKSLEDFVANLHYAQKVSEWQADCIYRLSASKQDLASNMALIEQSVTERNQALEDLDASRQNIEQTIDTLLARAQTLEEEERLAEEARLSEIARQAELEEQRRAEERAKEEAAQQEAARLEAERQEEARQQQEAEEAERQRQEAAAQEAEQEAERQRQEAEQAADQPAPEPDPEPEPVDTSSAGDWVTCIASAYTIADNDPPGSTATASGIPLDESVPTVAMPMSINPARFYGSKIQIEYEGMSVVATITDCGYLSGGARGLDITPAIFRTFGFSTADDWGLRQVRYRFL